MNQLNKKLIKLKKLGVTGIKQSLEDEGSSFKEIVLMRDLTKKNKMKLNVKIGGCEAKNDIFFCKSIKTDSIVAPMVESDFAVEKFIQCAKINKENKLLVNLETNNALKNVEKILKSKSFKYLDGVVIGRSDLAGSLGLSKKDVNTSNIFTKVKNCLNKIKKKSKKKLLFKMGGSITSNSKDFIKKLYDLKLLAFVETRNIEIKLSNKKISNLKEIIKEAFEFEMMWLNYKLKINKFPKNLKYTEDFKRVKEIQKRVYKNK